MRRLVFSVWIGFLTWVCLFEATDYGLTLGSEPEKKPMLMGLKFGGSITEAVDQVKQIGLKFLSSEKKGVQGKQLEIVYEGIPEAFPVKQGHMRLHFDQNQLVQVDLEFNPSYNNFLLVRQQLLSSLGKRFSIHKKQEYLEPSVRTQFAHAKEDEAKKQAEKSIAAAIRRGTTFFSYQIKDSQEEFDVMYSFRRHGKVGGQGMDPSLILSYRLKEEEGVRASSDDRLPERNILPSR